MSTYDPKARELAEHFLQDYPSIAGGREAAVESLSQTIQDAVEEWFEHRDRDVFIPSRVKPSAQGDGHPGDEPNADV